MSVMKDKHVPWDSAGEWVMWLILLVIATFFIHNGMRTYKESK